jgi:hypothetical protein
MFSCVRPWILSRVNRLMRILKNGTVDFYNQSNKFVILLLFFI